MERANKSQALGLAFCLFFCSSVLTGSCSRDHMVKCGHKFNRDLVHVTCNTTENLSQVGCLWYIALIENETSQKIIHVTNTSEYAKDIGSCKTTWKPLGEGQYLVSIIINSTKVGWKQIAGDVSFNIKRNKSPTLKEENALRTTTDSLVQVGDNVTLVCYDNESVPLPYNISVTCGGFKIPSYDQHDHKDHEGMSRIVFKLNKVMDHMDCMCEAYHISSPRPSKTYKSFPVFSTPLMPACNYSFIENLNAEIVCTTTRVYPKAKCTWHGSTSSALHSEITHHRPLGSDGYMSTTCLVKLKLSMQLSYTVHVTMFPDVNGADLSTTSAVTSQPITVLVDIPRTAPVFKLKSGPTIRNQLTVVDQENVTVVCSVAGGKPMVHQTQISCDKKTLKGTGSHLLGHSNGSETSINLQINKSLHQMSCKCSAHHVSQAYNLISTFTMDVQNSAKIKTFTINKRSPSDAQDVIAKSETTLTCTAYGDPLPTIVISYINSTRESTTLSRDNAYELSRKWYPTCSDTGLYRCSVFHLLSLQEETNEFNLKVACAAEYYQTTDNLPSFGVPVNEDFNITLSVRVYPEPKNFSLFQGFSTIKQPKKKILFNYTNENFSLGEISIAMRLQNEKGLGMYSLRVWNPQESTLKFNLTAEGRPLCPTDFIIENVSTNAMTISWRPGFDGGLRQTFSVFSHDPANNIIDSFQVEQTSNDVMMYNVTGLSEGKMYILSIETENNEGKTKCPHVNINGTTSADSTKIQTFTINKCYPKEVKYVNANSETTLTCTTFGHPLPTIVISYINSKQKSKTLSRGNAYELSHKFYPTCSDTGLYRCSVSNMLNAQEETRELNLKVTCPAEYYPTADTLPLFGVPVNEDLNITLPVRVYPEPKDFSLFQGLSTIKQPKNILFTYTNENFSLGEISIAMRIQNETGLGMYSLRVWKPQESNLNFSLTAEGSKQSPSEIYSLILYIGLTAALMIISGVTCGLLCNKRVALKRWCTFQSSHNDLYDTQETRETPSQVYYLQPVHSVGQVQDISPNEYDMVIDDYEDALS